MNERINLAELRQKLEYAEGWLSDIDALHDTPQGEVLAAVPALIEAAAILPQIEWKGEFNDCPLCEEGGTPSTSQHADGCQLAATLARFDLETPA